MTLCDTIISPASKAVSGLGGNTANIVVIVWEADHYNCSIKKWCKKQELPRVIQNAEKEIVRSVWRKNPENIQMPLMSV